LAFDVHRRLGGRAWLDRAGTLAELAARAVRRDSSCRDSLYKGEVGVAVLAAELPRPEWAALLLVEREGRLSYAVGPLRKE
jgi:eukaryotic-like serine/threonine-protein kinase